VRRNDAANTGRRAPAVLKLDYGSKLHPVAFVCKKLTVAESRHSSLQKSV